MKSINLAIPTIVNMNPRVATGGELRYPSECPLTVPDSEAQRLFENNLLTEDPEDVVDDVEDAEADDDGLEAMTVANLHLLVTKEGVALNDVTKKADIIAAVRKHREEKAG